jgi:hypothetical protein
MLLRRGSIEAFVAVRPAVGELEPVLLYAAYRRSLTSLVMKMPRLSMNLARSTGPGCGSR